MTNAQPTRFTRDRFTWLAYVMLGYFAYLQAAPGVAMPLLRADLNLSYTVGGLHVSMLALGMVLAGMISDRVVARLGRPAVFWGGGAGMAVGALLLATGPHPAITISGMGVMGLLGTMLLTAIQSGLADRHGARRAIALTEANVVASASTILPPLLIGGLERTAIGWQGAFVLPALLWAGAYLRGRSATIPTAPADTDHTPNGASNPGTTAPAAARPRRLPRAFWGYWLAMLFVVAVEWSIVAWGADFLVAASGLRNADASLLMTLYFVAMMLGRATGSGLARRFDLVRLVTGAIGLGVAGFALLWLVPVTPLRVLGLFVAGLGVANMFPYLLSIGLNTAPRQSDIASSRLTLSAGLAILLAPQTLGSTADLIGIRSAMALIFVLFGLAFAFVHVARRIPPEGT